jgi:hypothetical protein
MTHDEMTTFLRGDDSFVLDECDDAEIADRLDRYRNALIEARNDIMESNEGVVLVGMSPVDVSYIDEALK